MIHDRSDYAVVECATGKVLCRLLRSNTNQIVKINGLFMAYVDPDTNEVTKTVKVNISTALRYIKELENIPRHQRCTRAAPSSGYDLVHVES